MSSDSHIERVDHGDSIIACAALVHGPARGQSLVGYIAQGHVEELNRLSGKLLAVGHRVHLESDVGPIESEGASSDASGTDCERGTVGSTLGGDGVGLSAILTDHFTVHNISGLEVGHRVRVPHLSLGAAVPAHEGPALRSTRGSSTHAVEGQHGLQNAHGRIFVVLHTNEPAYDNIITIMMYTI